MKLKIILFVIIAMTCFFGGYWVSSLSSQKPAHKHERGMATRAAQREKQQIWTCSMHPQIRKQEPGKCPICGMDLIPAKEKSAQEREIQFSQAALALMEVRTSPVERRFVHADIRMVGKVAYDQTRIKHITAWVPGRIDRLYADFEGTSVGKGEHMVYLYSPDLLSAQEELLQALEARNNAREQSSGLLKRTTQATLEAAREKLRLLGLKNQQIRKIEKSGKPTDHITIYAPIGGIVIDKNATEGMYVQTGTMIYTVADLSKMWVLLDAYESDMEWLRYGQDVTFSVEAYPGEVFHARINFIDPQLNPETRTVKIRLNVDNPDGKLKPEMFVRAVVRPKVAAAGKVMAPQMAGKWICPMHPGVVKDNPGNCDICGMKLSSTVSLGYEPAKAVEPPLIIPASAPLITGKRAVVYVRKSEADKPTFIGREIVLGPRAGDYYIVESGLKEGQEVVTQGNFKIDADLQIQAKPSMMSIKGPNHIAGTPDLTPKPKKQKHSHK